MRTDPDADADPAGPAADVDAPPRRQSHATTVAGRVAAFAVVAVLLTWPLAVHVTSEIPQGTESVATVPWFNLWTLRWNQESFPPGSADWWDAPIFAPETGTFALSDPQPLTGLVFAPISAVTGNPVLAYNLVLLGFLTLNGIAGARLARRAGATTVPAMLAGLLAESLPFVFRELGVIQLVPVFPLLFGLDALRRWGRDAALRPALELGAWTAVTFLTSTYYGLFWVVVLPLAALRLVDRSWLTRARLRSGLAGAALAVALTAPYVLGIASRTSEYERSAETIQQNSAEAVDWTLLDDRVRGDGLLPWTDEDTGSGQRLYPGTALLALGVAGWWVGRRRGGYAGRWVRCCATFATVAAVLSIGLRLDLGGVHPYDLLRQHLPGFENLRSPFRFAVLTQVGLVALAAEALRWVWERPDEDPRRTDWIRSLLVAGVCLVLIEVIATPLELTPVPQAGQDWVRWLADPPDGVEVGTVAMVPFVPGSSVEDYEPTVGWMLLALDHGHPLVNGYSGLFPPANDEVGYAMETFPDPASLAALRSTGASHAVIARDWLDDQRADDLEALGLDTVYADDRVVVVALG